MNKCMYWFGIVLAMLSIIGGIAGMFLGTERPAAVVVLLGYILLVLLDLSDKYLREKK